MYYATPTRCSNSDPSSLNRLFTQRIDKNRFRTAVHRLHTLFSIYARTSPTPLPAPGLIITPEIRVQSELYLPIAYVTSIFSRLYSAALTYPPILSSTYFHNSMSWADTFASLPSVFQSSANPARLLELLLQDNDLMASFLFASFLPGRFYGGSGRYQRQREFIRDWLKKRGNGTLACLDAACGTGEETYALATLLSECEYSPDAVQIEGWTLEPLEVWAAANRRFPNDVRREAQLREATKTLIQQGFDRRISFSCRDILASNIPVTHPCKGIIKNNGLFNLIICNGLLCGPIIHDKDELDRAVFNLVQLLAPGGILLAADNFHGGWKQKCPQDELQAFFKKHGLMHVECKEGLGGLKPD